MTVRGRLLLALGLLALVIGIGLLQPTGQLAPIDELGIRAANWLRRVPGSGLVSTLSVALHWLGEPGGRLFLMLALGMFLGRAGRADEIAWLFVVVVGLMLLNTALKLAFAADRPLAPFEALIVALGHSFPSGHASGAMSLYGGIALLTRRRAIHLACAAMILATGASRVWLGVHWPSDVAAGWLLGVAWLLALSPLRPPADSPALQAEPRPRA